MLRPVKTIAAEVIAVAQNGPHVATQRGVRSLRTTRAAAASREAPWITSRPNALKRAGCGSRTPSAPTMPAAAKRAACALAAMPGVNDRTARAVSCREGL